MVNPANFATHGVSIHAPARGATTIPQKICVALRCFNPRAREGRDFSRRNVRQSLRGFNPRAREGRDRVDN